jgi:membrane fusion protein (multidrug efflux system)
MEWFSKVNVQPGQYVNTGQALFAVVHSTQVWVVANFKETQLNKMRDGQYVIGHRRMLFRSINSRRNLHPFHQATGSNLCFVAT